MYVCMYVCICASYVMLNLIDGEQTEAEQLRMEENMYALSMCRVLHIGASKVTRNKSKYLNIHRCIRLDIINYTRMHTFVYTCYIHTCLHAYMHYDL